MESIQTQQVRPSKLQGTCRRFWVLQYMPPWKDIDGNCIAPPDANYKFRFAIRGIHASNEECAEWLLTIAGSGIVRLCEDMFEFAEALPAMTIDEWKAWEVGKEPWELIHHGSDVTLYFDDYLEAKLDAMALRAKQEIDELCAEALQRIEQFA
ncbi:TPA: hypothetical protein L4R50_000230 [Pseudomonas aeruginosa]|nr:hypothetical protein [Pseudomonas aeruginosa]